MTPPDSPPDEARLRAQIPVFVNSFEQLTYLRDTVNWLANNGFSNVTVLEQGSAFAPLLDYLASDDFLSKARLHRLGANIGPRRAVRRAAHASGPGRAFIFTDPDLDLPNPIAPDFLTRMFALGDRYKVAKVGLALDVSDADKNDLQRKFGTSHTIRSYYRRFFTNKLEPHVFGTNVDTTFFLHVPQPDQKDFGILSSQPRIKGIRVSGPGFLTGHRPWYFQNGLSPEEETHYRHRATVASTHFGREASA